MVKILAAILLLYVVLLSQTGGQNMSDREIDGLVGPVQKVVEEYAQLKMKSGKLVEELSCRSRAMKYDEQGRLLELSSYPGFNCDEEIRDIFSYDQNGNRLGKTDSSGAGTIRTGGASEAFETKLPVVKFKYDSKGKRIEQAAYASGDELLYKIIYVYDLQVREAEVIAIHSGRRTSKTVYEYDKNLRFPARKFEYDSGKNPSSKVTYSDYQFNTLGDWIQRKEAKVPLDGSSINESRTGIRKRTITYFEKKS